MVNPMARWLMLPLLIFALGFSTAPAAARRVRCSDFQFQEEAQTYMQQQGAMYLDGDRDGIACETLPRRGRSPHPVPVAPTSQPPFPGQVISVGDGDSLRVRDLQGNSITIRLGCIDAPETSQQPWGLVATQRLREILPSGVTVSIRHIDRDRYGRQVAELYHNGQSINLQLIREGMAAVYRQYLNGCATTQVQYLEAEAIAQSQGRGIWNPNHPIPVMPWDFRRQRSSLHREAIQSQ